MKYNAALFHSFEYDSDSQPDPILSKLHGVAELPHGWRFGEGIPPTPRALTIAKETYQNVSILRLKADAFPVANGGLTLVFYAGDSCVELSISPEGQIDLSIQKGKGFDFEEIKDIPNISISDVTKELWLFAQQTGESKPENRQPHNHQLPLWNASSAASYTYRIIA